MHTLKMLKLSRPSIKFVALEMVLIDQKAARFRCPEVPEQIPTNAIVDITLTCYIRARSTQPPIALERKTFFLPTGFDPDPDFGYDPFRIYLADAVL